MPEKIYNTPLVKKLGITEDCRLVLVDAPGDFLNKLTPMPEGVEIAPAKNEPIDVAVLFVTETAVLKKEFPRLKKRLAKAGGLWVAYPKKASKVETDITFEVVQGLGLKLGLVDNKICAVDDIWTGLRFVYRRTDR
jgi:hypothetical protein